MPIKEVKAAQALTSRGTRWRLPCILVSGSSILALTAVAFPAHAVASALPAARTQALRVSSSAYGQSCPEVEFLGAPGSGEKSIAQFRGVGPEVNKMFSVIQGMLQAQGITFGTEEVMPYPANPVTELYPSVFEVGLFLADPRAGARYYYNHNLKKFLDSVSQGVTDAVNALTDYHAACPATVFVMGGYSLGAMVIHQAENKLSASLQGTIAGMLLLGDGNRVVNTKAKEFGTSPARGQGVATYLTKYVKSLGPIRDIPLYKTTANICNIHDAVCDFNSYVIEHFPAAGKVHTSYSQCTKDNHCTYQKVLSTAATWVGNAVITRLIG